MANISTAAIEWCLIYKQYLARLNTSQNTAYCALLPKQIQAIRKSVYGDTLVVLPTGYGKSLIFQILPYSSIIVVSPLNAIITEQSTKLANLSIHISESFIQSLIHQDMEEIYGPLTKEVMQQRIMVDNFKDGKYLYVIGHPEHLLHNAVKTVLASMQWKGKISHIVVGEAHCILSWGKSQFQPSYLQLKSLCAIQPQAKVLALTATASVQSQKEIAKALIMHHEAIISVSPDRYYFLMYSQYLCK